jgi:hypothetical protein
VRAGATSCTIWVGWTQLIVPMPFGPYCTYCWFGACCGSSGAEIGM